jgi:hypothetical protein
MGCRRSCERTGTALADHCKNLLHNACNSAIPAEENEQISLQESPRMDDNTRRPARNSSRASLSETTINPQISYSSFASFRISVKISHAVCESDSDVGFSKSSSSYDTVHELKMRL